MKFKFDKDAEIWLTSFWGYSPESWGCLSFTEKWMRDKFVESTNPGVIVAIYVTGHRQADPKLRDRLVGFYEVTHQPGHLYEFISEEQQIEHAADPERRKKWHYSLRASRAWEIRQDPLPKVRDVLPGFVTRATGRLIGYQGMPITEPDHISNLLKLPVEEVPIFGGEKVPSDTTFDAAQILKVSRAVYPPKEPYFVAESNGPKHLYVLRLSCQAEEWCLPKGRVLEGKRIFKVGFSKSPNSRVRQIQAAYPDGKFAWEIFRPEFVPDEAPFPDAETAIKGENAMKKFLQRDKTRILGGEFFLATDAEAEGAWQAGVDAASNHS